MFACSLYCTALCLMRIIWELLKDGYSPIWVLIMAGFVTAMIDICLTFNYKGYLEL